MLGDGRVRREGPESRILPLFSLTLEAYLLRALGPACGGPRAGALPPSLQQVSPEQGEGPGASLRGFPELLDSSWAPFLPGG